MARKKREVPEINASSMADIAFLLLVFFLVTTTFDSDYAIERRLPPKLEEDQPKPEPQKERNLFILLINKNDELFVNGERGDMQKLKEEVKRFIINPANDERLSEKSNQFQQSELLKGKYYRSKGVITLQADRMTSY
ncbi:MAG TPA: biopolymer transporter ExbD, partial [Bacteroidia bacterium]